MSSQVDNLASAVLWPISLILNMVGNLPPLGVVLSSIVSILAIVHYFLQIRKVWLEKKREEKQKIESNDDSK